MSFSVDLWVNTLIKSAILLIYIDIHYNKKYKTLTNKEWIRLNLQYFQLAQERPKRLYLHAYGKIQL